MGSCLSSSDDRQRSPRTPFSPSATHKHRKGSKRRQGSLGSSSFNSRRDEQLHAIPGRMFLNGSSSIASLFTQQGRKGTNQDAMIVWENFGSREDTVFCGVFDGHGPFGHMVARKVRDSLPVKISAQLDVNVGADDTKENGISAAGSMNSEDTASVCLDEEPRVSIDFEGKEADPEIFVTMKESFLKAFKVMDKELRLHPKIDCFCSGTTAVTLVKQGQDLVIGNIGDSRAVLGTRDEDDCLIAVQLTVDLKPNLPSRILITMYLFLKMQSFWKRQKCVPLLSLCEYVMAAKLLKILVICFRFLFLIQPVIWIFFSLETILMTTTIKQKVFRSLPSLDVDMGYNFN